MTGFMSLPDIAQFAAVEAHEWRALGLRLAETGLTSEYLRPITQIGADLPSELRLAVQRWHLRRIPDCAARAARLLMFEDSISEREVCDTLGQALSGRLLRAGILVKGPDGAVGSPFHLCIADRIYVFCDDLGHGGDAVMGAGETTIDLCRAMYPTNAVGRALEIGCGAGTIALVLSQRAERVLATDINPRALALGRINAAINGIGNVAFRAGDAFDPVEGDAFDLIVSQPPFVAQPRGAHEATYLYGGERGDELPRKLLKEVCSHLTPSGRAVLMIQWPDAGGEAPEALVRRTIGCADASVLVLRYPAMDPDYHCAMYAAAESVRGSGALDERLALWRNHLESLGIRKLESTLVAIQRDPVAPVWTAAMDVPQDAADQVTSASLDQIIANHNLANTDDDSLLRATLRPPEGTVFTKEYTLEGPRAPAIRVRLPESSCSQSVELSDGSLLLISMVAEAETVAAAVAQFAARQGIAPAQAAEKMIPALRQSLKLGVLRSLTSSRPMP